MELIRKKSPREKVHKYLTTMALIMFCLGFVLSTISIFLSTSILKWPIIISCTIGFMLHLVSMVQLKLIYKGWRDELYIS